MTTLSLKLDNAGYDIHVGRGLLEKVKELIPLDRKAFIITDSGVPREYAEKVKAGCENSAIYTVKMGEDSKSIKTLEACSRLCWILN